MRAGGAGSDIGEMTSDGINYRECRQSDALCEKKYGGDGFLNKRSRASLSPKLLALAES